MSQQEHTSERSVGPVSGLVQYDLVEVAEAMRSLSQRVAEDRADQSALDTLVTVTQERVPGARWVSVSVLRSEHFITAASTDEQALRADALQYELGDGPCVEAVLKNSLYVTGEVSSDPRWDSWGKRVKDEFGVTSVLSQRLHLMNQDAVVAGLNIYSDTPHAFDRTAVGIALILATHGGMVLSERLASQRAENLNKALQSNREIGVAMGVLMNQHQFTRQQAFDVLRVASQNTNRKLADVAVEVADTGALTIEHHG
jgi:hypothetical protein